MILCVVVFNVLHRLLHDEAHLSLVVRKRYSGFPTRSDTIQAVQLQKMARGLQFRIKKVEGLHYPCSENEGADQLRDYREAKLICVFVFAYAKSRFSHNEAHFQISLCYHPNAM